MSETPVDSSKRTWIITSACAGAVGGVAAAALPSPARAQASRYDFWFTRLKYDSGDWDVDARMPSNLITSLIDYTTLRVDPNEHVIALSDPKMLRAPFCYLAGHTLVEFNAAERQDFYTRLFQTPIDTSGTPLRSGLDAIGKQIETNPDYFRPDPALSCRQNFAILTTDGYWNDSNINGGSVGVLHGMRTYILQDEDGQTIESHSISAGLDYPGVGPEHSWLQKTGRVHYGMVKDANALNAFQRLCRAEGILPALESSHAVAWVLDHPHEFKKGDQVVVNLSGRGDKDLGIVNKALGVAAQDQEEV